ncbi:LexA family protein [Legionella pneumophila]|uniref:LexA family protein n=1 Tax=Legionella pneumophila TaxID=446 RepID=UPI003C6CFEE9
MNIKKEIGKRIFEARKAKGLTLKALGELAGGLKQTRLTNWEQGVRTPGPEEIKSLARALDVSPAYLMCLSDAKQFEEIRNPSQLIPLLDYCQACKAKLYTSPEVSGGKELISVSTALQPELGADAFALKIIDDSMLPEFRPNDVLVVDPSLSPKPGDYVIVAIEERREVIVCKYKKLSYASSEFELITLNDNWPNLKAHSGVAVEIVGVVIQNIRVL